jgi:hypothetical protein
MPGRLYYMAPGQAMSIDAGTVLLEFSPKEGIPETDGNRGKKLRDWIAEQVKCKGQLARTLP